jgi:SAM-dependent methyltransferase
MNEDQLAYWSNEGAAKTFSHPVNTVWLQEHLAPGARILDYGCGYGRIAALLAEQGYRATGVDPAAGMIEKARRLCPTVPFQQISPPATPFADNSFDAAILFAVLTCIPPDEDQRRVVNELHRILRSGGLLYVSDFWLQTDERNQHRYAQYESKYGIHGVFEVAKGVAVRHHTRQWIASLLSDWESIAQCDFQVITMNGHEATAFQWLGRTR